MSPERNHLCEAEKEKKRKEKSKEGKEKRKEEEEEEEDNEDGEEEYDNVSIEGNKIVVRSLSAVQGRGGKLKVTRETVSCDVIPEPQEHLFVLMSHFVDFPSIISLFFRL